MEKALPRLIFFQLHLTIIDNKTIYQNTSFKQIIINIIAEYNFTATNFIRVRKIVARKNFVVTNISN